ncbi:hypothetical protein LTR16_010132, partial [Cryomyces antarcticus]
SEEGRPLFAGSITLPYMRPVTIHFIMKGVEDRYKVIPMVVDSISEQQKASAMSCTIITTRVPPRSRNEEVCMNCLVKERVDRVRAWTILEQWLGELQTNAPVFALVVLREFADASA